MSRKPWPILEMGQRGAVKKGKLVSRRWVAGCVKCVSVFVTAAAQSSVLFGRESALSAVEEMELGDFVGIRSHADVDFFTSRLGPVTARRGRLVVRDRRQVLPFWTSRRHGSGFRIRYESQSARSFIQYNCSAPEHWLRDGEPTACPSKLVTTAIVASLNACCGSCNLLFKILMVSIRYFIPSTLYFLPWSADRWKPALKSCARNIRSSDSTRGMNALSMRSTVPRGHSEGQRIVTADFPFKH